MSDHENDETANRTARRNAEERAVVAGGSRTMAANATMGLVGRPQPAPENTDGIGFGILGIGLVFLFGWVVMLLWNWLMPDIFGLKRLTYWQAWGLLVLCHILFKGFGSGHGSGRSDRKRRRHLRRYMREEQAAAEKRRQANERGQRMTPSGCSGKKAPARKPCASCWTANSAG